MQATDNSPQFVYAHLSFMGQNLEPKAVTNALQLEPTSSCRKGELVPPRRPRIESPLGSWRLTSAEIKSLDAEENLSWLVDKLLPVREQIHSIQNDDVTAHLCLNWHAIPEKGAFATVRLSQPMFEKLATLGLPLEIQVAYRYADDPVFKESEDRTNT